MLKPQKGTFHSWACDRKPAQPHPDDQTWSARCPSSAYELPLLGGRYITADNPPHQDGEESGDTPSF